MKVLVPGGGGQLGRALVRRGSLDEIIATPHSTLDIRDPAAIDAALNRVDPDVVINAAAYTAVDNAETERELAFAINAAGAGTLAAACASRGIPCIHVSTDYVFDGTAQRPYREDDRVAPRSVYGESKAEGERRVHAAGGTVVRTSWLFEQHGPSFVHTILRLAAERSVLRVVADQHGCPTWADDLADALLALAVRSRREPTYHFCNSGVTTWHEFAEMIVYEARRHRSFVCERVDAISTADHPTPARRPAYSVLDTTKMRAIGIEPPPWSIGMTHVVHRVMRSSPWLN